MESVSSPKRLFMLCKNSCKYAPYSKDWVFVAIAWYQKCVQNQNVSPFYSLVIQRSLLVAFTREKLGEKVLQSVQYKIQCRRGKHRTTEQEIILILHSGGLQMYLNKLKDPKYLRSILDLLFIVHNVSN